MLINKITHHINEKNYTAVSGILTDTQSEGLINNDDAHEHLNFFDRLLWLNKNCWPRSVYPVKLQIYDVTFNNKNNKTLRRCESESGTPRFGSTQINDFLNNFLQNLQIVEQFLKNRKFPWLFQLARHNVTVWERAEESRKDFEM